MSVKLAQNNNEIRKQVQNKPSFETSHGDPKGTPRKRGVISSADV